jgi:uncharacterized protein
MPLPFDGGGDASAERDPSLVDGTTEAGHVIFRTLDHAACVEVLERNHVGRVAFSFHDRVDIEPIHYVFAGGWVYGRTSEGAKLTMLGHNPWVAFEVDEIEGPLEWRSVVAHGAAYFLSPEGGERDRETYELALRHLRSFYAGTLTEADVAPFRTVLFRIFADDVTGRMATTKA